MSEWRQACGVHDFSPHLCSPTVTFSEPSLGAMDQAHLLPSDEQQKMPAGEKLPRRVQL